jgi:protein-tyrosine phosphatase
MIGELERIPLELGLTPMLAHIERYPGRKQLRKFLPELERMGVAMQCNAETFLARKTRRWGLFMVKKGFVHFLGTDAHNLTTRAPRYAEAIQVIAKKLGQEVCDELTKPL